MQVNDDNERRWQLAIRSLEKRLSGKEEEEWRALLREDSALKADFEQIKLLWQRTGNIPYHKINIEAGWKKVSGKVLRQWTIRSVLRYAAVLTALLMTAYWVYNYTGFGQSDEKAMTMIEAPAGSQTRVILPDSSTVWLNAGSKIVFNSEFGISHRQMKLEGEAFFEVQKDEMQFQVVTPAYTAVVLGTAFNIRAYPDDPEQVTTLVHGSLRVNNFRTKEGLRTALLKPGDRLTLTKTANPASQTAKLERGIDISAETAWKDGWLSVRSETLEMFAKRLERLYDITIHFEDQELKNYRYTGKIRKLSLEQVLNALALTSPIKFDISEKVVTMRVNEKTRSKYPSPTK